MRIYLIRHGETEYNVRRIMQGHAEIPLNDTGMRQAALVGERLKPLPIERIVASDIRRAAMTAAIVGALTGVPVEWDELMRERNPGELAHRPYDKSLQFFLDPEWEPPGGESGTVFDQRVRRAFDMLAERYAPEKHAAEPTRHIAVVTHGMVCAAFMRNMLGYENNELLKLRWPNASITIADYRDGEWAIHTQSDDSHIDASAASGALPTARGSATGA